MFQGGQLTPANGAGLRLLPGFREAGKNPGEKAPAPSPIALGAFVAERNLGVGIDDAAPNEVWRETPLPLLIAGFLRKSTAGEFHD